MLSLAQVCDVVQYFTMAWTGSLLPQGFYVVSKLPGAPLRQERRKAITRLEWNLSREGEERLQQGRRCPAAWQ